MKTEREVTMAHILPLACPPYFIQVFAIDLPTLRANDRDSIVKEIVAHVPAAGALIKTYQKPASVRD